MRHPPSEHHRTLDEQAVILHELYSSLCRAGFDQAESLALVGFVMLGKGDALGAVRGLLDDGRPGSSGPAAPGS